MASMWDLRSDDCSRFEPSQLPHVKDATISDNATDVSSVHWNPAGDRLVTSSSDMVARIWKVDDKKGI